MKIPYKTIRSTTNCLNNQKRNIFTHKKNKKRIRIMAKDRKVPETYQINANNKNQSLGGCSIDEIYEQDSEVKLPAFR